MPRGDNDMAGSEMGPSIADGSVADTNNTATYATTNEPVGVTLNSPYRQTEHESY